MIHGLKVWPEYFDEIISGRKSFEVRQADRPYRAGDLLALNEYNKELCTYTGRFCLVHVDHLWCDPAYVREGYVVMSIKPCYITRVGVDIDPSDYSVPCYADYEEDDG